MTRGWHVPSIHNSSVSPRGKRSQPRNYQGALESGSSDFRSGLSLRNDFCLLGGVGYQMHA